MKIPMEAYRISYQNIRENPLMVIEISSLRRRCSSYFLVFFDAPFCFFDFLDFLVPLSPSLFTQFYGRKISRFKVDTVNGRYRTIRYK